MTRSLRMRIDRSSELCFCKAFGVDLPSECARAGPFRRLDYVNYFGTGRRWFLACKDPLRLIYNE